MNQFEKILNDLGLNKKQADLYLTSVKLGQQPASVLAKFIGIPRSTAYYELNELLKSGLFTKKMSHGVTKFQAIPPNMLEKVIDNKLNRIQKIKNNFKQIIPELEKLEKQDVSSSNVSFYSGVDGLCRMLDDFSSRDEVVRYISAHDGMDDRILDYVKNNYLPRSSKHKNKNKIIINSGDKALEYKEIAGSAYDEFIFIDPDKYKFNLTTAIYSDKVAFWSYKTSDLSGFVIRNRNVSDDLRVYFDIIKKFFQNS